MLIDLTNVPRFTAALCKTTAFVRIRAYHTSPSHRAAWSSGHPGAGSLLTIDPAAYYPEGDTRIFDYRILPRSDSGVTTLRVETLVPKIDRPWQPHIFWLVFLHDPARILLDNPHCQVLVDLLDYDKDSNVMPPPPQKMQPEVQERLTVWDRLRDD